MEHFVEIMQKRITTQENFLENSKNSKRDFLSDIRLQQFVRVPSHNCVVTFVDRLLVPNVETLDKIFVKVYNLFFFS